MDKSPVDLVTFGSSIATQLPDSEDEDGFCFKPGQLPILPSAIETEKVVIQKGIQDYNGVWRTDYLQVYAAKKQYEALGILTLCVLLDPALPSVELRLTNPKTDIKTVVLNSPYQHEIEDFPGLHQRAIAFAYWPEPVKKLPWGVGEVSDVRNLPSFYLSNRTRSPISNEDWRNRNTIFGFGSSAGTVRIAELFLNMSRPTNEVTEFVLESDAGFGGVAPMSAEICLWLPGGDHWIDF
jgi:hypothetical protein